MMNIALVDDMQVELELIEYILKEYAAIHRMDLSISCFTSSEELLADYHPLKYSIIFLDIYMEGLTGVQAAEKLRNIDRDALIIFLTSSDELDHMLNAFSFHAYDYILKPTDPGRLFRVMDDILENHTDMDAKWLFFNSNRRDYSLPYSDIVAVRTDSANYLEIIDQKGQSYRTRMTFSSARELLDQDRRFLLILRGVIINMDYVTGFSDNTCHLEGDLHLPINVRNSQKIEQTWQNYRFSNLRHDNRERSAQL